MATLTITRGLPGSGKTTWARAQTRTARLNRDDFRRMMHDGSVGFAGDPEATEESRHRPASLFGWAERQVTLAQRAAVEALLRSGVDVVCDDTNLRGRVVREFAELAYASDAAFVVRDFTDVPLEECIARDARRTGPDHVGEDVIRAMHQRYLAGRTLPLPVPVITPGAAPAAYRPSLGLPEAILVDIDGTVALMGDRSPYDMTQVAIDKPHEAVITAVRAMHAAGHRIIFCSGRSDDARAATEAWLARHVGVPYEQLFMRKTGDQRKDSVVKAEIFERYIRDRWRITGVFDDRNQVVRMWRSLGLTVFQVAEGSF